MRDLQEHAPHHEESLIRQPPVWGHQAVRYKRLALHSCFLLSLLTCKLCSPPLYSLSPKTSNAPTTPPPLRSRWGCGKYWKFTVKVHLGRVALERHASEVDFDCKFPILPCSWELFAPRWRQDGPKMAHFLGRSPFRLFLGVCWDHFGVILGLSWSNRTSIFVRRHRIFGMLSSQSFVSISFHSRGISFCRGSFLCDIIAL